MSNVDSSNSCEANRVKPPDYPYKKSSLPLCEYSQYANNIKILIIGCVFFFLFILFLYKFGDVFKYSTCKESPCKYILIVISGIVAVVMIAVGSVGVHNHQGEGKYSKYPCRGEDNGKNGDGTVWEHSIATEKSGSDNLKKAECLPNICDKDTSGNSSLYCKIA